MAGYSGTTLVKKLGFAPGDRVFVKNMPGWYTTFAKENSIVIVKSLPATHVHIFFDNRQEFEIFLKNTDFNDIEKFLWVSWPKKTSVVKTDLTEQTFRDLILPTGWVDIKVAAIDDTWSGLKFTRRKHLTS